LSSTFQQRQGQRTKWNSSSPEGQLEEERRARELLPVGKDERSDWNLIWQSTANSSWKSFRKNIPCTTLDLYSQSIDAAKLEVQEGIALAIRSAAATD